jgi:hypothetical protein
VLQTGAEPPDILMTLSFDANALKPDPIREILLDEL